MGGSVSRIMSINKIPIIFIRRTIPSKINSGVYILWFIHRLFMYGSCWTTINLFPELQNFTLLFYVGFHYIFGEEMNLFELYKPDCLIYCGSKIDFYVIFLQFKIFLLSTCKHIFFLFWTSLTYMLLGSHSTRHLGHQAIDIWDTSPVSKPFQKFCDGIIYRCLHKDIQSTSAKTYDNTSRFSTTTGLQETQYSTVSSTEPQVQTPSNIQINEEMKAYNE